MTGKTLLDSPPRSPDLTSLELRKKQELNNRTKLIPTYLVNLISEIATNSGKRKFHRKSWWLDQFLGTEWQKVGFAVSVEDISTVHEVQQIIKIFSHPIID